MDHEVTAVPQLRLTITEAEFQSVVTDYAELMRWRWCHYFPLANKRGRYQTPVHGHPGCPDIILARGGMVLLVELKRAVGARVSGEQRRWLLEAGDYGRLWTPHHWNSGEIIRTLRHHWKGPIPR